MLNKYRAWFDTQHRDVKPNTVTLINLTLNTLNHLTRFAHGVACAQMVVSSDK